jgi:hypothetical protein
MGSWFRFARFGRLLPHTGADGKGQSHVLQISAGDSAVKPDIRVFSAEFALAALETGDFVPISSVLDASHAGSTGEPSRGRAEEPGQEPQEPLMGAKDEAVVEGTLTRKEMQARDGAAAMAEYQAARRALVENTARLREARLAREAAEAEARKAAKAAPGKKARGAARQK